MRFSEKENDPVILQTKITPASLPADIIFRPRLIKQLNDLAELPVVLIVSPAGYGKSCLVSLWSSRTKQSCAWVSLDREDGNYDRFWSYFIASFVSAGLDAADLVSQAFSIADTESASHFIDRIIERLLSHQDRLVLILDDYHNLDKDSPVHASVSYLISHLPENVHLVVTSRVFPRIGLQKLRVQGLLGEITEADLSFTLIETEDLFYRSHHPLTAEESQRIHEYTKGWPVAVKLASLAYAKNMSIDQIVPSFEVGELIHDYLFEEVIGQLPEKIRTFLAITACVEGFSVSLAQYLTGEEFAEVNASLQYLKDNSLFISEARGTEGNLWYRYHALFLEAVLHRSISGDAVPVANVREKASLWYEKQGLLEQAAKLAAQAHKYERIQELIYKNWNSLYRTDRFAVLMRWYEYLPGDYIEKHPMLCAIESLPLATSGNKDLALQRIGVAEHALKEQRDVYYGLVMSIKGLTLSVLEMSDEAELAAKEALKYLPEEEEYLQGMSYQVLGGAKVLSEPEEAARIFKCALAMPLTQADDNLLCSARANLSFIYSLLGDISESLEWANATMAPYGVSTHESRPMLVYAYGSRAFAAYKQGNLDEARRDVSYAIEHVYDSWNPIYASRAYAIKAHLDYFASEDEAADEGVRKSIAISSFGFARQYPALPALLFWMEKGVIEKDQFAALRNDKNQEPVVWVQIALDFVGGGFVDLKAYEAYRASIPEERILSHIQFKVLLAAMQEARGDNEKADKELREAIDLSRKIGTCEQVFIENAPYLIKSLRRIAKSDSDPYFAQLYRALPASKMSHRTEDAAASSLTAREKDVMRLMVAGLSTKEIAERLFVSTPTAKKHLANIYTKLGVHGRVQAIAKLQDERLF